MNEPKYRGYAEVKMKGSQWQYGFGVSECEYSEEYAERLGRKSDWLLHGDSRPIDVHEGSIGKFIGLTDMKGVEIFEGDILKIPDLYETPENTMPTYHYAAVSLINGAYCVNGEPMFEMWDYFSEECEVIGNMFEHAHLISQ